MRDGNSAFNDKESVTADPTDAAYAYAVWDRLVTDQAGASLMARTTNGGLSWEPARVVYDPGTAHQTINNQLVVLPDGSLVVFFSELGTAADGKTPIALMGIVRSTDKGLTWSPRIKVTDIQAVGTTDPRTGESLRDGGGLGQIAADRSGKLYIVWQDARYTGARDAVLLTTSTDGGLTWSTPVRVNADPTVPAFTPAIALARDGTIGVTYYDLRSYASGSAALLTDYWLARSGDGVNWVEVRAGGPFDMGFAPDAGGLFLGDYQALAAVGNIFLPFFAQANSDADNRSDIMAAVLAPDLLAKEFGAAYRAPLVGNAQPVPGFAQRVQANLTRARLLRLPGMGTSTR
jgi:hypothetical protein